MKRIDQEPAARRLARAIAADIQLYNADAIARRDDLSDAIAEGRELYRSRVDPSLHGMFETALAERPVGALERRPPVLASGVASGAAGAERTSRRPMSDAYVPTESERRGSSAPILVTMGLLVVVAIGALVGLGLLR